MPVLALYRRGAGPLSNPPRSPLTSVILDWGSPCQSASLAGADASVGPLRAPLTSALLDSGSSCENASFARH